MLPQILVISVTLFLTAVSTEQEWLPIKDQKSHLAVEIATFAVVKHNEEAKSELKLESIVKGEYIKVGAHSTRYRLILVIDKGGPLGHHKYYEAVVSRTLRRHRSETVLNSFRQLVRRK